MRYLVSQQAHSFAYEEGCLEEARSLLESYRSPDLACRHVWHPGTPADMIVSLLVPSAMQPRSHAQLLA